MTEITPEERNTSIPRISRVTDDAAAVIPFVHELTPAPEPWSVAQRLADLPRLLFFDSADPSLDRYSFVTADPFEWITSRASLVFINGEQVLETDPFAMVDARTSLYSCNTLEGLPPFQGGAAGLFGYDLCHHLERLPRPRFDEFQVPDMAVGMYDWVVAFDHAAERAWVISTGFPESDPQRRRRRAEKRCAAVLRHLGRKAPDDHRQGLTHNGSQYVEPTNYSATPYAGVFSNLDRPGYMSAVERILEYIRAGDCFQVNLAQRLLHRSTTHPLELYGRLRKMNAAPFGSYFDLGEFAVASASPEQFLRVRNGEVETRPIKGTRPRGLTLAEDAAYVSDLRSSAKDRSENTMIVDLLRNDLGRVCAYGSVHVPRVCQVESYPFVHHLVSEVRGRLRTDVSRIDLLRAAFPGGSVTGAPKIRAMEIIAELEPHARGPYCGSLGYIGFDGNMDTSILIRTCTIGRGWVQFPVGGGIVADSVPEREYEETWAKAEGLLRALQ